MSVRRRRATRQLHNRRIILASQILALVLAVILGITAMASVVVASTVKGWLADLPSPDDRSAFEVAQTTRVYSADGRLLARLYLENREVVPISKISTNLVNAVVAIEDERFYTHNGIDPVGIVRAAMTNIAAGSTEEGASTITQQYVRNTVLAQEATDISIARKIREAYLAMELEKRYTKAQILQLYLNAIYFGEGAHGAQTAARTYFDKPASKLTLPEAALLAGLPQQPYRLTPFKNPDAAMKRRDVVLSRMLANGYITQTQYNDAIATKLKLKRAKEPDDGIYFAPYYVAHVKKLLQSKFSEKAVFKGGLTVYTSLDTRLQKDAERAVKQGLPSNGPSAALVSIDPRNGYVKALVGGKDYHKSKFNLATQGKRQPGSSFKTFTLVTAIQEGMPPYYTVDSSSPAYIPTKPTPWQVSNSEGSGKGAMTLEKATHLSVNTVYARVAWGVGAKKIARTANRMGIKTKLSAYPSIALGAQNVTPLEMASAYGTLATGGVHHDPVFITKVVDSRNKVLLKADTEGRRVLSGSVAYATTRILEGVISSGTARRAGIGRPAAGKTGTSQRNRDVWFVGYTPQLVTSVWVGHRQEQTIYVYGSRAFGGTVCAPIWANFMSAALKGKPALRFKVAPAPKYTPSKFSVPRGTPVKEEEKKTPTKKPNSNGNGGSGGGTKPPVDPPVDPPPGPDTSGTPTP